MKRTIIIAAALLLTVMSASAQNPRKEKYIPLTQEEKQNVVTLGRSVVFFDGAYGLGDLEVQELREMVKLVKGHDDYLVRVYAWTTPTKDPEKDEYFTLHRALVVSERLIALGMNKNLIVELDGKGGDPTYKATGDSFYANRAEVCVIKFIE